MVVYLNGQFVPEQAAYVSVFDRAFLYGDGLFETIRVYSRTPALWDRHIQRLASGAKALRLPLPVPDSELRDIVVELLDRNHLADAVVRLNLSRGIGRRGYSIRGANQPNLVIAAFSAEPLRTFEAKTWRLHTSTYRVPENDPLASFKTTSKLTHVLARAEAEDAGADEALILNTRGYVAESSSANVFWIDHGVVHTPPLAAGGLAGVTRGWLIDLLGAAGWQVRETDVQPEALLRVSSVFLTVSSWGLVRASHLDGRELGRDPQFQGVIDLFRSGLQRGSSGIGFGNDDQPIGDDRSS